MASFDWRQVLRNCSAVVEVRTLSASRAIVHLDLERTDAWNGRTPADPVLAAAAERGGMPASYLALLEAQSCVQEHGIEFERAVDGLAGRMAFRVRRKWNWRILQRLSLSEEQRAPVEDYD